jgi:endonuclease IV
MFGFHVRRDWAQGKRPGLANHVKEARAFFERELSTVGDETRTFAFQVFVAGPRQMKFTADLEEANALRTCLQQLRDNGRPTWGVAHGTFMDAPWSPDKPSHKWTLKWIRIELRRAASAGLAGLVVHLHTAPVSTVVKVLPHLLLSVAAPPGERSNHFTFDIPEASDPVVEPAQTTKAFSIAVDSIRGAGEELKFWSCHIRNEVSLRALPTGAPAAQPDCVRLYLEVPAVLPANSLYETPAKLAVLFRAIRREVDPFLLYFGLCIDTAHIWASGADIASFEAASAWLDELEKYHDVIPPHAIIFHLNDNCHNCGTGRDAHAPLFKGTIWGDYADRQEKSGLAAFLNYARTHHVPTILERGKHDPRKVVPPVEEGGDVLSETAALRNDLSVIAAMGY